MQQLNTTSPNRDWIWLLPVPFRWLTVSCCSQFENTQHHTCLLSSIKSRCRNAGLCYDHLNCTIPGFSSTKMTMLGYVMHVMRFWWVKGPLLLETITAQHQDFLTSTHPFSLEERLCLSYTETDYIIIPVLSFETPHDSRFALPTHIYIYRKI